LFIIFYNTIDLSVEDQTIVVAGSAVIVVVVRGALVRRNTSFVGERE